MVGREILLGRLIGLNACLCLRCLIGLSLSVLEVVLGIRRRFFVASGV